MTYEPSEDSYLLQKYVAKFAKNKKVLDLGTGLGVQTITALENGAKSVLATDIDQESVEFVKKKIRENFKKAKVKRANLFRGIKEKFDLIIFNPPYLPLDQREDKKSALATTGGKKGYELIEKFLKEAKKHLTKKGMILLVFSSLTKPKVIKKLAHENKFRLKILETKNLFFERLFIALLN